MGDSTPRMQRHRAHAEGDHYLCVDYACRWRKQAEAVNEYRLRAKVLVSRGVTNATVTELANLELPDYEYLPSEPDPIHHLATETDEWEIEGWFTVYEQWKEIE